MVKIKVKLNPSSPCKCLCPGPDCVVPSLTSRVDFVRMKTLLRTNRLEGLGLLIIRNKQQRALLNAALPYGRGGDKAVMGQFTARFRELTKLPFFSTLRACGRCWARCQCRCEVLRGSAKASGGASWMKPKVSGQRRETLVPVSPPAWPRELFKRALIIETPDICWQRFFLRGVCNLCLLPHTAARWVR